MHDELHHLHEGPDAHHDQDHPSPQQQQQPITPPKGRFTAWAISRIELPEWPLMPIAGTIVGVYSGLAAGVLANAVGALTGLALGSGEGRLWEAFRPGSNGVTPVSEALHQTAWHLEYVAAVVPPAFLAIWLARGTGGDDMQKLARRRLLALASLSLGALLLYYLLLVIAAFNTAFGHHKDLLEAIQDLPTWTRLVIPAIGGLLVGRYLQNKPEVHGHGIPEVVSAIQKGGQGIDARGGFAKLIASSITIGSGGSTGREGPIVFGAGSIAASVGQTLGFSRKELCILIAAGSGAGIAASFNAPIAGAVFALEILLREIELKVFSPIILASVAGTIVGRAVLGSAPVVEHVDYYFKSGWEVITYTMLGLIVGFLSFVFVRMLHHTERFFKGQVHFPLSHWLGRLPPSLRAALGGVLVGSVTLLCPIVWGSGHEYVNMGMSQKGVAFFDPSNAWDLVVAAITKMVGTVLTLASGGAGGLFFPSAVLGTMAGGAFGSLAHSLFPSIIGRAGAYATVGMGAAVAAILRGPMMAMMMVYELTKAYDIMVPLMITCTIASEVCHLLRSRASGGH